MTIVQIKSGFKDDLDPIASLTPRKTDRHPICLFSTFRNTYVLLCTDKSMKPMKDTFLYTGKHSKKC